MPPAFSSAPLPVSRGLAPLTYEKKKNTNNPTGSQALNQSPLEGLAFSWDGSRGLRGFLARQDAMFKLGQPKSASPSPAQPAQSHTT